MAGAEPGSRPHPLCAEACMVDIVSRLLRSTRSLAAEPFVVAAAAAELAEESVPRAEDRRPTLAPVPDGVASPQHPPLEIEVRPLRVARAFAWVVGLLLTGHVLVQIVGHLRADPQVMGLLPLLNVGTERNLPTFYSASVMLVCSGLLLLITRLEWRSARAQAGYWAGLALVFCGLACDEMLVLHEKLIEPVRDLLGTSGALHYAWVIPYGAFALCFACAYASFLWRLPRRSAELFVLSGAIFVSGALVMEMLGAVWIQSRGHGVGYVAFQTVEEGLEMSGIVLFLFALLDYIAREHALRVCFRAD